MALLSLWPAYFQCARIGQRLAGALLCIFLLVSLVLDRPPLIRSLRGRRLGILLWPFRCTGVLYRCMIAVLILAYARCVAIPFYFLAVPLLIAALVPRVLGKISYNAYLFLVFDLFMVLTLCMFTPGFWQHILSRKGQPDYLFEIVGTRNASLTCEGKRYEVEESPVWMRRVHLYENDSLIVATNGYEFLPEREKNIAGMIARRSEKKCSLRWYYGSFSRDMIYDRDMRAYFTSQFFDKEILALDEQLKTVKRLKLANETMDLFLCTTSDGGKRLLALSFLEGKLLVVDPLELELLAEHVYSPLIANCNFIRMSEQRRRLYCAVISWGYIAALVDIDNPDRARRGVLGLGSWGIDMDPASRYFYISDFFLGRMYKVDEDSMKVVASALLRPGIRPVVFDPKRRRVYVGDYYLKDVFVLDENLEEIARLSSNGRLTDMALSQDGALLYTVGWRGVYAIDLEKALAAYPTARSGEAGVP